jgi:hypothetical protein
MTYEFTPDVPQKPTQDIYSKKATAKFQELLENSSNDETKFQEFFEQNPHFVPGSRDEFSGIGGSGHHPHFLCLISQPKISGLINRQPDFMWLANDSVYFSPIIIEIEAPSKKHFKKDGKPTSHFNQAVHQLKEWQTILSRPENILKFYEDFSSPQDLRELTFRPHFALIYGRRSEFKDDKLMKMKRGNLLPRNQTLMTYDRIAPNYMVNSFICCTVKDGTYFAKYVSPLFHLGPYEDYLLDIYNLDKAILNSKSISLKRRKFLVKKLLYCLEFLRKEKEGIKVKIKQNADFQMKE